MKTYEVINTLCEQDVFDNFEECNIYFFDEDHIYYPAYWVYSKDKIENDNNSGSLIILDDFDRNTIINIFKVKPHTKLNYLEDKKALIFTKENINEHN